MSGIYIPNMEMPTEVCFVNVMLCNDGRVFVYKNGGWVKSGEAVPVPPHGRLIDADALEEEIWSVRRQYQLIDDTQTADKMMHGVFRAERLLKDAPTVIPAEEGE